MGVPNLWIPADRDFYRINEMPVLGSGKLDLRKVKELALALACR
jgi:acyl-[acyl-carrier-protein]-phospholipid O-acyltransferase/long-chain-fatty-acid--[acyl-carrier-protein] ligase